MAYLGSQLSDFTRNRNRLLTGEEEPRTGGATPLEPEYDLSNDVAFPQVNRQRVAQPRVPSPFGSRRAPTLGRPAQTPTQPQAPLTPSSSQTTQTTTTSPPGTQPGQDQTPGPAPPAAPKLKTLPAWSSFQKSGSLASRLFDPISKGATGGQETLSSAADLFKHEAGPSRTYESTGAEGTLSEAYKTGSEDAMGKAREYLAAEYTGPQGLDPNTVAGLQKLTEDLKAREKALQTGGGLSTLIGQSVSGLTPGEALFEAKRELPGAKVKARDLGFEQVNPLVARLLEESRGAEAFAKQRTGEEADIAEKSKGFLTGERTTISDAIDALIADRLAGQQAGEEAFAGIMGAEGQDAWLKAIRDAAPWLVSPPGEDGGAGLSGAALAEQFFTPGMAKSKEAEAAFQAIMNDPRFAGISQYDPLELGVSGRGKQVYDLGGEDIRKVVEDPALRKLLYDRQQELEAAFDPLRGQARPFSRTPGGGGELAAFKPLYGGDGFQAADPREHFSFDPGIRPSRGNSSTEEQRDQFNRINDLLGELDRISETDPFRAASIFADADKYLADEEKALEEHKGELTENAKDWVQKVKKLRKSYRKKAREEAYGKIAGVIGGAIGGKAGEQATSGVGAFFGKFLENDPLIGGPVQRALV